MKIAILGDSHFGSRGDNVHFHHLFDKFYNETFFPKLKELGITHIVQLGDLFDRRKYINFQTLFLSKKYFFNKVNEDFKLYTLVGNHDSAYKNTIDVNSPSLLLKQYENITVCEKPTTITMFGVDVDLIPWICKENEEEILEFMKNSSSKICFGHFELSGFEMDRGNMCVEGMDRNVLSRYDIVLSGHFHHKSTDGHIFYTGAPYEMTWSDYDDKRGFHILDLDSQGMEFYENPHKMFHKIVYDDTEETIESIKEKDFSQYKERYVKVVITNKNNPYLFDVFIESLYNVSPLDVTIVENFIDYSEISEEDIIDESQDTITILNKYVEESIETKLDKNKLKNILNEIYNDALALER
jgi:hypothetical protein